MSTMRSRRVAGPALAAVLALAGGGVSACSSEEDSNALAPSLETEVPDIRGPEDLDDPYQGYLDAAFREDLEAYAQQEVTVLADVAEVLGPRAFTLTDPGEGDVEPVLVVTAAGATDVEPEVGQSLVVAATAVDDLDVDDVTEELGGDVEPELLQEWEGDAYLVATILEPAP